MSIPHESAIHTNQSRGATPAHLASLVNAGVLRAPSGFVGRDVSFALYTYFQVTKQVVSPIGESELKLQKFFKLNFYKLIISTRHLDGDITKPSPPPPIPVAVLIDRASDRETRTS